MSVFILDDDAQTLPNPHEKSDLHQGLYVAPHLLFHSGNFRDYSRLCHPCAFVWTAASLLFFFFFKANIIVHFFL